MSDETFEIEFAAVVQFKFYSSNESDRVESAFEDLYGGTGETRGGPIMMGSGFWQRTNFSWDEDLPDELSQFESIRTYLAPDKRHVYDAMTVGRLDPDTVAEILSVERDQARSIVSDSMKALIDFTDDVPTIPTDNSNDVPTVFYVEPADELDIGWTEDGFDESAASQWLKSHQGQLQRIKILLGQPISLVGTEDLLAPQSMGAGYIRQITVLNTSATHDGTATDIWGPPWLRRLEGSIKPYYRIDCWLNHRRRQIGNIDEETHGTAHLLDGTGDGLEFLQSAEADLESLRESWVNQYTLIQDEIADLEDGFQFEDNETPEPSLEIPIPLPEGGQEPVSLFQDYEGHLKDLFDIAKQDMDRIGDKLERHSQFIHDSVTARTAASNVELQTEVKELTRVLTWLTVLLAVVGVIQLGMTFWP